MQTIRDDRRWIMLTEHALDIPAALAFLETEDAGALNIFIGTTRRHTGDRETERLSYEAHVPMALQVMEALAREAETQWPILRVCIHHRLGEVPVGEASVCIGVATPHRAEAFTACRWLIDRLKQQVPIWKKEWYTDGTREWVRGQTPEIP